MWLFKMLDDSLMTNLAALSSVWSPSSHCYLSTKSFTSAVVKWSMSMHDPLSDSVRGLNGIPNKEIFGMLETLCYV